MIRVPYVPDRQSVIPNAATLTMHGKLSGKIQHFQVDLLAFLQKANEVRNLLPPNPVDGIRIENTVFVTGNGDDSTGVINYLNKPYLTINAAADAVGPASQQERRCIVVYAGDYVGDIDLSGAIREGCRILFMPGANVYGNITIGNGCHLHFSNGCTVYGNITDGGLDVTATICGCVELRGYIIVSGTNSIIEAEGDSFEGCDVSGGSAILRTYFSTLNYGSGSWGRLVISGGSSQLYCYNITSNEFLGPSILVSQSGGTLTFESCRFSCTTDCIISTAGSVAIYDSFITAASNRALDKTNSSVEIRNSTLTSANGVRFQGSAVCSVYHSQLRSMSSFGLVLVGTSRTYVRNSSVTGDAGGVTMADTAEVNFSNCYVRAQALAPNADAITISATNTLILSRNTIVAQGTGESVICAAPVNITVLWGNQANAALNANVTPLVTTIDVDAAVE